MSNAARTSKAQNFPYNTVASSAEITDDQHWFLSYYRSSELTGSLLMGKYARLVKDDELRSRLTWHFAEEARHAWRWTELLRELGKNPLPIKSTYQSNYFKEVGIPESDLDIIIITQVFEQRVAKHLTAHAQDSNLPQIIRDIFEVMISDEGPHLNWGAMHIKKYIEKHGDEDVISKKQRYSLLDKKVYAQEVKKFEQKGWNLPDSIKQELL